MNHGSNPVLQVTPSNELVALARRISKQGVFEPDPPIDQSWFAGVYVVPVRTEGMQGAGLLTGYRSDWLALTLSANILRAGYAPGTDGWVEAHSDLGSELYGTIDVAYLGQRRLCLGGGIEVTTRFREARRLAGDDWEKRRDTDSRLVPLLVVQDVEQRILLGGVFEFTQPAARLDIGSCLADESRVGSAKAKTCQRRASGVLLWGSPGPSFGSRETPAFSGRAVWRVDL